MQTIQQDKPVEYAFLYIGSSETRMNYESGLKEFFDYLELPGDLEQQGQAFLDAVKVNHQTWAQENIMRFLTKQKERVKNKELSAGSLGNFIRPIKKFCDVYDDVLGDKIKWNRMIRAMPSGRKTSNDRSPTLEEIRKIVNHSDRRTKVVVYIMCSSGIRLGAWKYLRWKHVKPKLDDKGNVSAAKLLVYDGEGRDEYFTFITPEAYYALKEWMDFRESYGEKITGESWLLRNLWRTADMQPDNNKSYGQIGLATVPEKIDLPAIKKIVERAWRKEGIRLKPLPQGQRRYEFKGVHGFRKFFETRAMQVMKQADVELLIGHSLGLAASYYKPTEEQLLEDYLKAVPYLTINSDIIDKSNLQKQVAQLTEKSEEANYVIRGKLAQKEKEMEEMKAREAQAAKEMEQMKLQHQLDIEELKEDVQEALKLSRKLVITDNDWLHHREEEEVEQRRRQEELQEYRQMKREKLMQQLQQQQQRSDKTA